MTWKKVLFLFSLLLFITAADAHPIENAAGDDGRGCKSCHYGKRNMEMSDFVKSWFYSRHAATGVTCVDCHLKKETTDEDYLKVVAAESKDVAHSHMIEGPGSNNMKEYFVGICGGCHTEKLEEFKSSVHGAARLKDGRGVSCIDCHDPHRAATAASKESMLYRGEDLNTCGRCHKGMLKSYMSTFHGKQFILGNSLVPTCTYCHIGHEPPTGSPESAINSKSVGNLCAGCHGKAIADGFGVDEKMIHNLSRESTGSIIHYMDPIRMGPFSIASAINSSYFSLIIGVVGFFTLLSTRDYIKKTREESLHKEPAVHEKRTVKRFSLSWRIQHVFWAFSFIVLAVTGLSLKFPDSTLSQLIVRIMGGAEMRSSIHRISALVFMATAAVHLMPYILRFRSPRNMLLTKKDFLDALLHVSYLFDRADRMPLMGRYAWYQKLEYWATVIGASIVISTGILMWGFESLIKTLPLSLVLYSQMIHGWEAILAVLVILVHHIYHTVLNPLVFPMDLSWITGRSKYSVMKHEHPLELMEIEGGKEREEDKGAAGTFL